MKERSHLLLVSYYFPPLGMGGVQRVMKLAKYLPEFGWDVTIITPIHRSYHVLDDSLEAELPESAKVIRVAVPDPARALRLRGRQQAAEVSRPTSPPSWAKRLQQFARWPDDKFLFVKPAVQAARRLARRHPFHCVLTSSPPPSVHRVGLNLSSRNRVGWLADFRDPWLVHLDDWGPTRWHERYAKRLRREIVKSADALIAANDAIASTLDSLQPRRTIEVIHNGYDEADFASLEKESPRREEWTVLFYGTLAPVVDPSFAFRLLGEWRRRNPQIKLRVVHVGLSLGIDTSALARDYGIADVFDARGYLPHHQAVASLATADLIVLPLANQPNLEATVPGRLFEALRSLRPILLTASAENESSRILRTIEGAWQVEPDDLDNGMKVLDAAVALPRGQPVRTIASIQQFDRRAQAQRVADLLENVRQGRQRGGT